MPQSIRRLGDVHRADPELFLLLVREHAFVQGRLREGQIVQILEAELDIVRVEHGQLAGTLQIRAEGLHVGPRAQDHAELPPEGMHTADGLPSGVDGIVHPVELAVGFDKRGPGRNGTSVLLTQIAPEPGPPPPCGVENVLCRFMCMTSIPIWPMWA